MPRHRTLKSLFIDVVVFVGMFALLGHISMNFWERFIIQTELSNMKTSLHSLKETINKIGYAYDKLHQELLGLAKIADKKTPTVSFKKDDALPQRKKRNALDRALQDIQIQAMVKAKDHTTLTSPMLYNKTVQNLITHVKNMTTQDILRDKQKKCSGKNMSTVTRYPTKSTKSGFDKYNKFINECPYEEQCKYKKSNNVHRCCKDYECYSNPINNWRF